MVLNGPTTLALLREQIKADTEAFLAKGGQIQVIPPGIHAIDYSKPSRWDNTTARMKEMELDHAGAD